MTQSPELAGGAGFTFGDQIATQYLACLLAEVEGLGLDGRVVCRVALEQRDAGEPLDDLIVDGRAADGSLARLSLQVKRELTISDAKTNTDFRDTVRDAWLTLDKAEFRHGIDRVGAVTGASVNAAKARDLQTLAELARASATPAEFAARFAQGGSASQDQAAVLAIFRTITTDLGRPATTDDLYRLLRHFTLIKFDALHEGADGNLRTVDLLRHALQPVERSRARDLHQRLQVLAREGAGRARSWDAPALRRDVSADYALAALPSLASDLDRITHLSRAAAVSINSKIGPSAVARPTLYDKITAALQQHRFVALRGLPGTGKSALLRRLVEDALEKGPAILLKADRLLAGGWAAFAAQLGLKGVNPVPLLAEIGHGGTPILFIDGLDRVDKAQREIIYDLVNAIEATPELGDWRVLATLRDAGLEPVRTWLPGFFKQGCFASIEVASFDDEEAAELAKARPELRPLLFGQANIRELVRRPFFARILHELGQPGEVAPRSEIELMASWWRRGGFDAEGTDVRLRQRTLLQMARERALRADAPVPLEKIETSLLAAVEQLVSDEVLEETGAQQFARFRHDIFFEWAYAQVLITAGADWPAVLREAGEPPIVGRAVELLGQRAYIADEDGWSAALPALSNPQLRSQWRRVWLLAPVGHPDFTRWITRLDQVLFGGDQRLLEQTLVWFQAQRTIPNPNVLSGRIGENLERDSRLRVAEQLGWPDDFAVWARFLSYLDARVDQLATALLPAVLETYKVWQNAMVDVPNRVSTRLIGRAADWLTELETRSDYDRYQDTDDRWNGVEGLDEFKRALRSLVLRSATVERERVAKYLGEDDEEKRPGRKVFEDVVAFSPVLATTHPRELVNFTLRHLRQELPEAHRNRMLEQEERAAACRAELRRKPEAERTRMDEMALASPTLGYYGPNRWDWDHLALERGTGKYFPAAPTYEPFNSLFASAPQEALRLVSSLSNHAVEAWRQLHRMEHGRGRPVAVTVDFPWGQQTFWGGRREYLWSRGLWAPKVLASALQSLDRWALDQVEAGADADELIKRVVEANHSIAALGIAVYIALAARQVSPVTKALVVTQRLWRADIERCAQEGSIRSSNQIGFMRPDQRADALAVKALHEREVRALDIRALATLHALGPDQEQAEAVRAAIRNFLNDLAFEYEEERNDDDAVSRYREEARLNEPYGHLEYYRVVAVPGDPEHQAIQLENPVAKEPETVRRLEEGAEYLNTFGLFHWAERSFRQQAIDLKVSLEQALEIARLMDAPDLFSGEGDNPATSLRRGAVAGVAAVLVSFAPEHDASWAWSVLNRAAVMQELGGPLWTSRGIVDWHPSLFAARALAAAIRRSPTEQRHISTLLTLTTHPLDCVSLEAAKLLIGLWDVAPRMAWQGLRLALDLCIIPADEIQPGLSAGPQFAAVSRSQKLQQALASLTGPAGQLPIPPRPWQQIEESRRRRRPRQSESESESDSWHLADGWWESGTAGQLLEAVPLQLVTKDPVLGPLFVEHCEAMLRWTIERTAPAWNPDGRNLPDTSAAPYEWVHSFGTVLGSLAGYLERTQVNGKFLDPICVLADEPAFALLTPLTLSFMCEHVFDAPQMSANTSLVLDRALDRLLAIRELRRGGYRAGELYGQDAPRLAQWLMFVGVGQANLAARFVNGDWSEIGAIMHLVERFVRSAGWAPTVMSDFLTLVERAREHFPADAFADLVVAVLTSEPDPTPKWRGTLIAARLAARIQDLADRQAPLPLALGQKFLRILDLLVDRGDRRSAALQVSTTFRDLRL